MAEKPRFYITTAIAYPNGAPHIGYGYEVMTTDAIARFKRLDGFDVFFLTGTDEHGIKMLQSAAKAGVTPREWADRNVERFQAMATLLNCSNDQFIRTTEPRHHKSSQAIWERMKANGDIYLSKYAGWYSVRDEAYYDESETRIENGVRLGAQGTPVEWVEEESYFFKLSAYADKLLKLYADVADFVLPRERLNEVSSFVRGGLQDLSISRTTFDWGVKVPGDEKHVMYVWVDALTNYITAAGFPDTESAKFKRYWPADLHVIGKDIVRFHAVYWPAFLMSAGLEVPRHIFCHGWILNRGEKMSKSVGNVADPFALVEAYGVDPLRYFFMREVSFGQDGNYSHETIVARINADLANDLGNLAQRSLTMIGKQFDGTMPKPGTFSANDQAILAAADGMIGKAREAMKTQALHQVLNAVWAVVADANRYFAGEAPWALAKTDPARQGTVLYVTAEVIRQVAILALPFMPASAEKLLDLLNIPQSERDFTALGEAKRIAPGSTLPAPAPVFPRYVEPEQKSAVGRGNSVADQNSEKPPVAASGLGQAQMTEGDDRQKTLQDAAAKQQVEMEAAGARIRDLVLAQPPTGLLGYLWSQFFMGVLAHQEEHGGNQRPDTNLIQQFQLVLEYVHAVWSSHGGVFGEGQVDETKAKELIAECDKLGQTAMLYGMLSSQSGSTSEFGDASADMEFHAKSSWVLIRGHRYQVLEREFFEFALGPHNEALKKVYSVGAAEIAAGMQSIANTIRAGYSGAAASLFKRMQQSHELVDAEGISLGEAVEKMKAEDAGVGPELEGAFRDMFFGGICNVSRHTELPEPLLADMSYQPGQEDVFFADGAFKGTPFRTLPARVRPLIKLDDGYYATDGQFVRDSAYRSIQRGVIARLPDYREGWNKNQKAMTETAFPKILSSQLKGARLFEEVYFKDVATGAWVETDLVVLIDDVLFVIEAKAGVMAMQSPATNFESHVRTIRELVLKAYRQCKRFLDYLASGENLSVYRLQDGNYEETTKIDIKAIRSVFPIGLTVEAFTPFSSMCKVIPEVAPILGKHAFVSMSVDDLFVIGRFLPSAGELLHYLQVRQAVAGMPKAMMFDEIDHLGAYITRNRFDQDMRQQLEKADMVMWDSFSDRVDRHFEQENWETDPVPHQSYPAEITQVLELLDRERPQGWLRIDSTIRDYDEASRTGLASIIRDLTTTLRTTRVRRFLFGSEVPIQFWLTCEQAQPTPAEMQRQGEIACLAAKAPRVFVVRLQCDESGSLLGAQCSQVATPPVLRSDYPALVAEADRQLARSAKIAKPQERKKER